MAIKYGIQMTIEIMLHDEDTDLAGPVIHDTLNALTANLIRAGCKDVAVMANGRIPDHIAASSEGSDSTTQGQR